MRVLALEVSAFKHLIRLSFSLMVSEKHIGKLAKHFTWFFERKKTGVFLNKQVLIWKDVNGGVP